MGRSILKLYYRLPVFFQNIAISCYGLYLYLGRYTGVYPRYLKLFSKNKHRNLEKEQKVQNKRFLKLLHYAARKSPFYREFYKDIRLEEIKSVEDIHKLPVLSKELLKENINGFYTIAKGRSLHFSTGGTGGMPLVVRKRPKDVQQRMAYLDAYKLTFGFHNNKMRSARFFGKKIVEDNPRRPIFWRTNYPLRQRLYSTYHLTQKNLPYFVRDLNRYQPQAIDGFVSAIYTVAKYMEENSIPPAFSLKAVFTTSETVLPYHRETIERVFHCPLSDQYASNEGAPFIIQCSKGSYHEAIDTGIFEHIPTEHGIKLLVTGFDTFGTPLIRYDIGDMVLLEEGVTCACGSVHPVIQGIAGREAEYLETGKGRFSLVQLSVLISQLTGMVEQLQFRQRKDGSLDIICVLQAASRKELNEKIIRKTIEQFLGSEAIFQLYTTNVIERAPSGKYQLIIKE